MPATLSATSSPWQVCATTASPVTATVSHSASPSHIAARNGSTSRRPLVSTRATRAAMLGTGEPVPVLPQLLDERRALRGPLLVGGGQLVAALGRGRVAPKVEG